MYVGSQIRSKPLPSVFGIKVLEPSERSLGLSSSGPALRGLFIVELSEETLVADALSSDQTPMVGVGRRRGHGLGAW